MSVAIFVSKKPKENRQAYSKCCYLKDYATLYVCNKNEEDDRLLKYQAEKIKLVTPGEVIRRMETDA